MGRERGIPINSPRCNNRSKTPVSSLAFFEKGGVLTSPCSQTKGLSTFHIQYIFYVIYDMYNNKKTRHPAPPKKMLVHHLSVWWEIRPGKKVAGGIFNRSGSITLLGITTWDKD